MGFWPYLIAYEVVFISMGVGGYLIIYEIFPPKPINFHFICSMGASINYVGKNLPIFDPPPSVGKFTT